MSGEMKKLYVGASLTYASEKFKGQIRLLKERLRDDWEVMEFLGLTDGSEIDVYRRDIVDNVGGCDAFLGVCDEPAISLGWELCEAVTLGKPTLGVAHVSSKISRMV